MDRNTFFSFEFSRGLGAGLCVSSRSSPGSFPGRLIKYSSDTVVVINVINSASFPTISCVNVPRSCCWDWYHCQLNSGLINSVANFPQLPPLLTQFLPLRSQWMSKYHVCMLFLFILVAEVLLTCVLYQSNLAWDWEILVLLWILYLSTLPTLMMLSTENILLCAWIEFKFALEALHWEVGVNDNSPLPKLRCDFFGFSLCPERWSLDVSVEVGARGRQIILVLCHFGQVYCCVSRAILL